MTEMWPKGTVLEAREDFEIDDYGWSEEAQAFRKTTILKGATGLVRERIILDRVENFCASTVFDVGNLWRDWRNQFRVVGH